MKKFCYRYSFLVIVLYCYTINATNIILNKIWMHKGSGVELGKLSLYFSSKPEVHQVEPKKSGNNQELLFFIPKIKVASSEIEHIMNTITAQSKYNGFSIKMKQIKEGIEIVLSYDAKKVDIDYAHFESIGSQKGLGFTFYDKKFLHDLHQATNRCMLKTACLSNPCNVVIDCGHGGKDSGTIGYKSIKEKDITLHVGLQLADLLKHNGFKTILTRNGDYDVSLDNRTHHNESNLFISIHANNSKNKNASGIETYCFNPDLLSLRFTTMGNKEKDIVRIVDTVRYKQSLSLAHNIHNSVIKLAKKKHHVNDRNVKQAISQVLLATSVPAALIEIGFLSNELEADLLNNHEYQRLIAHGICQGIISYCSAAKTL